ncbi:MAG: VCBS repeat-containing protein, partial [Dehalococcoidales bacterium]
GDLDGDGDLDACVSFSTIAGSGLGMTQNSETRILLNDGSGNFIVSGQDLGTVDSMGLDLADLDNDGDLDVFLTSMESPHKVMLNNGNGTITGVSVLGIEPGTDVALGDLDGDGDIDAITSPFNRVWLNDGSANFSDTGQILMLESVPSMSLALDDLDGDGDLDAFIANGDMTLTNGYPNSVWLNNGSANFSNTGQDLGNDMSYAVSLGDLDGDNDIDAFVANFGNNRIWLNDGTGNFSDNGQTFNSTATWEVALGDFDGDGDLDTFTAESSATESIAPDIIWFNDGSANFSNSGIVFDPMMSMDVDLGDLDGDDDIDAYIVGLGEDRIWFNPLNSSPKPPDPKPCQEIVANLEDQISQLEADIFGKNQTITNLESQVTGLLNQISQKDQAIENLNIEIAILKNQITQLEQEITGLNNQKTDLQNQLVARDQTIANLQDQIDDLLNLYSDNTSPSGSVHAYSNFLWPPSNKMVEVTISGYVFDELSAARDGSGAGVSEAKLVIDGEEIVLNPDAEGNFSIVKEFKAMKDTVYTIELYAGDTNPIEAGGPNIGLVDQTCITVATSAAGK